MKKVQQKLLLLGIVITTAFTLLLINFTLAQSDNAQIREPGFYLTLFGMSLLPISFVVFFIYSHNHKSSLKMTANLLLVMWLLFIIYVFITG